jgi:hypothetical protein
MTTHSEQRDLFDSARAEAARDEAIAIVAIGKEEFLAEALDAVRRVAERRVLFTTDDVKRELLDRGPDEQRVWGAIMMRAKRAGWIEATTEHRLSERVACHRRPLRVWRSRIAT